MVDMQIALNMAIESFRPAVPEDNEMIIARAKAFAQFMSGNAESLSGIPETTNSNLSSPSKLFGT